MRFGSQPILEISLTNLKHNYKVARDAVAENCNVAVAAKADAYGIGAFEVCGALLGEGCKDFYFAYLSEAEHMRSWPLGSNLYVICLNTFEELSESCRMGLIPVLNTKQDLSYYHEICKRDEKLYPCVIHVDTGMNRMGLDVKDCIALNMSEFNCQYVLSHLACADTPEHDLNRKQLLEVQLIKTQFPHTPISLANSSGIYLGDEYHFNQVRPGCMIYGVNPTPSKPSPVLPIVTMKAKVVQIRKLEHDSTVSYGARHAAKKGDVIATIACGYADGYHRTLSLLSHCYFKQHKLPIIGTITMDFMMVDVSSLNESELDELEYVELLNEKITVNELAGLAKTIGYEIITSLGERFTRIYKS